jgi:hypothetical protein
MKRVNVEVPEVLFQQFVDALDAAGLHCIEYVRSGGFRYAVSSKPPAFAVASETGRLPDGYVPRFLREGRVIP